MDHWTLLDTLARLREAELRQWRSEPVPPATPGLWITWRRRLARRLVGLGLRLDAEASRALIGAAGITPRLNGSDA